ncbi:deoxynucleotidyltransferase terminal-interacting protein 1-like [Styela clava]
MSDVFIPRGYVSKTFWPVEKSSIPSENLDEPDLTEIQPFSVYHLDHPHVIRKRSGHFGASPRCRASATDSLDLTRKVLQPAINYDVVEVFKKYISVFRDATENIVSNMHTEPFTSCATSDELNVENMVFKACSDALEHCKSLFDTRTPVNQPKSKIAKIQNAGSGKGQQQTSIASSLPGWMVMKRVPSPDFPWTKRLAKHSPRRSLSPTPRSAKRGKATPRRYGSPQQGGREPLSRDNWDPDKLNTDTKFIMGTRANKALGLGATRGRIYMKHPELFKYSSDPDDKKWMVKNNCMLATGGKNTFIMIADNIFDLIDNEYKDSPHIMREELQVFTLPEFILQKMRALMIKEKKLTQKLTRKTASPAPPRSEVLVVKEEHTSVKSYQNHQQRVGQTSPRHSTRPAAERAAAAICASSEEMDETSNGRVTFTRQSDAESLSGYSDSEPDRTGRSHATG